jgi:hypothetical protein
MALLAEELVEEWLNRQGYFTIRGIKLGVHEMDLLAIRPSPDGLECRHLEVTASVRPIGYVTKVPREVQRATGRAPGSSKVRSDAELLEGVKEWFAKKFRDPEKENLRAKLAPGTWSQELVVHVVKYEHELRLIETAGIRVHRLADIVRELKRGGLLLQGAGGAHLLDLVAMATADAKLGG